MALNGLYCADVPLSNYSLTMVERRTCRPDAVIRLSLPAAVPDRRANASEQLELHE